MRTLLIALLAISCLLPETRLEAKESPRSCRILFPERPKGAPQSAHFFDGKRSQEIRLPSMNFSEVITLPRGHIKLYMTPDEVTAPEKLPPDAPSLDLPEHVEDFYILLSSDSSNPTLPIKMEIIDNSGGKLGPGETLWMNHSDKMIVAALGDVEISINPKSKTVSGSPVSKSGYYKAEFSYLTQIDGEKRRISEQQWWHDTQCRHLGFITDSGGILPKIFFYRDFR